MQPQTFLAVAVLSCATVVLASCQGSGDAEQTSKANNLEGSMTAPIEQGAPGGTLGVRRIHPDRTESGFNTTVCELLNRASPAQGDT